LKIFSMSLACTSSSMPMIHMFGLLMCPRVLECSICMSSLFFLYVHLFCSITSILSSRPDNASIWSRLWEQISTESFHLTYRTFHSQISIWCFI
jgi:hypothetical protein